MKTAIIKANYIIKSDLIRMLELMIQDLEETDGTVFFHVESNMGGELRAEFTDVPLPDLRQSITNENP